MENFIFCTMKFTSFGKLTQQKGESEAKAAPGTMLC